MPPRDLTFQEKKAAEAAFQGHPLEPGWSEKARAIYEGITKARGGSLAPLPVSPIHVSPEPADHPATAEAGAITEHDLQPAPEPTSESPGYFVDLTPMAREIGLATPVVMSKPLWDAAVHGPGQPGSAPTERVRAILRAVQQGLSVTPGSVAAIALRMALGTPEDGPRTVEIRVVVHAHPSEQAVTLLRLDEPWRAVHPERGTPAN